MLPLRLIFLLAILSPGNLLAQENNSKETGFPLAVGLVASLLEKNDSAKLLRYTSKSKGIYVLTRNGDKNSFQHFGNLRSSQLNYQGILVSPPVYTNLDDHCDKWTEGTFADTATSYHPLSEIAAEINGSDPGSIPEDKLKEFGELENLCRRVVINHKGKRMIIYLGYVMERWVLTMIDTRGCIN